MRDTYVKERKREKEEKRSGSAAGTNKKWRYSAVLSFIDPFVTPRKTTSNMVSWVEEDRTSEYGGEAQGADGRGWLTSGDTHSHCIGKSYKISTKKM